MENYSEYLVNKVSVTTFFSASLTFKKEYGLFTITKY